MFSSLKAYRKSNIFNRGVITPDLKMAACGVNCTECAQYKVTKENDLKAFLRGNACERICHLISSTPLV